MGYEGYTIDDDYLYIDFSETRETKKLINRAIEEAKEQRDDISRAIESLQVPDHVLRGYGDDLIPIKNSISRDIDGLQRLNLHIDYVMRRFEEVDNEFAARFRTAGYELQETLGLERDSGMFEAFAGGLKLVVLQGVKAWSGFSKSIKNPAAQLEQQIKKWFKDDKQKADKTAIITMSLDRLFISNKNVLEETQGMYDYDKMKCLAPKSPPSTQEISKKGNGKIKIYYKDGRTTEVDFSNANGIKWLEDNGWTDNPPSNLPPWGYIGTPPSWWTTSPPTKVTSKAGGATIGPDNGMGLPIDLYNSAVDSKYDNMSQDKLMKLTLLWYNCETKEQEQKILNKLSDFRDSLDSKIGKVLTILTKVTDEIDEFINEATMALMVSGFHFPVLWSELTLEQRIVAETKTLTTLETRYLKLNYQLFAEGESKIVLKGSYSQVYTQKLKATYNTFQEAGVDATEHGLNRVLGRSSRGVTVENTIDTYKTGKLYYDPQENTYIRFKDGVAVSYDISSGKIINVQTQNKPTGRWEQK